MLDDIGRVLQEIRVPDPPCVGVPSTEAGYWVEPHVVCEVGYLEITADGILRHPMFVRFRNDKAAEECVMPSGGGTGVEDRPLYRRRRWW